MPGDRVQMDVCKIKPGLYQYTAVDDCTRYRVLGLFHRKTAQSTIEFNDKVIEETPFPIRRIQTDRGKEFFAIKVQKYLMDLSIKFRPIKPRSPHLNGKVERSQATDLYEFYAFTDLGSEDLEQRLSEWQHYYNWYRPHGSLHGKTPVHRVHALLDKTPIWDEVIDQYDEVKEHIQEQNYQIELMKRKWKGCP